MTKESNLYYDVVKKGGHLYVNQSSKQFKVS